MVFKAAVQEAFGSVFPAALWMQVVSPEVKPCPGAWLCITASNNMVLARLSGPSRGASSKHQGEMLLSRKTLLLPVAGTVRAGHRTRSIPREQLQVALHHASLQQTARAVRAKLTATSCQGGKIVSVQSLYIV